jgi:hypothetical protein
VWRRGAERRRKTRTRLHVGDKYVRGRGRRERSGGRTKRKQRGRKREGGREKTRILCM